MASSKRAAAEVTKSNRLYGHLVPCEDSLTKQDDIVFCLRDAEENDESCCLAREREDLQQTRRGG
jgi:hypothetical protein